MIAVCQNVAMSAEDKLLMRHRLRKHKILMKVFPNQVGSGPSFLTLFPTHSTPVSDCSICAQNGIPSSLPWQLSSPGPELC